MNMVQALNSAMDVMLDRDPDVLVFGEDIAGYRNAKDPFIQRVMANAQAERASAAAH